MLWFYMGRTSGMNAKRSQQIRVLGPSYQSGEVGPESVCQAGIAFLYRSRVNSRITRNQNQRRLLQVHFIDSTKCKHCKS